MEDLPPRKPARSTTDHQEPSSPLSPWECQEEHTTTYFSSHKGVEVVQPYAIEEPGDEPALQSSGSSESTPPWQKDLVDSIDDLQFESDASGSSLLSDRTRGQKRKSASVGSRDQSPAQKTTLQPDSDPHEGPNFSPKRRRKKGTIKQTNVDLETANAALSSHASCETGSSMSSGSDTKYTDAANSAGPTSNPAIEMDVD